MYKDSKRTCRTIVLPFTCKLLVWRRFRCRRRRDLLKLPSQFGRGAKRRKRLAIGVNLPSSPALPLLFFSRVIFRAAAHTNQLHAPGRGFMSAL